MVAMKWMNRTQSWNETNNQTRLLGKKWSKMSTSTDSCCGGHNVQDRRKILRRNMSNCKVRDGIWESVMKCDHLKRERRTPEKDVTIITSYRTYKRQQKQLLDNIVTTTTKKIKIKENEIKRQGPHGLSMTLVIVSSTLANMRIGKFNWNKWRERPTKQHTHGEISRRTAEWAGNPHTKTPTKKQSAEKGCQRAERNERKRRMRLWEKSICWQTASIGLDEKANVRQQMRSLIHTRLRL